jgi:hypothetical protein
VVQECLPTCMTERTKCKFVVKENEHGAWIAVEEEHPGLPVLGNGVLALEFRTKTSVAEARQVAGLLRDHFDTVSIFGLP